MAQETSDSQKDGETCDLRSSTSRSSLYALLLSLAHLYKTRTSSFRSTCLPLKPPGALLRHQNRRSIGIAVAALVAVITAVVVMAVLLTPGNGRSTNGSASQQSQTGASLSPISVAPSNTPYSGNNI
jgi:hypothetical protein